MNAQFSLTSIFKHHSSVAQRKRAGLITRRTTDRNRSELIVYFCFSLLFISQGSYLLASNRYPRVVARMPLAVSALCPQLVEQRFGCTVFD
jgi:hypothetical protein